MQASRLDWVGVIRLKIIREYQSECIKEKCEYFIGLGRIRANRLYWRKSIRPNVTDQMRGIRLERRIRHCGNVRNVDKR